MNEKDTHLEQQLKRLIKEAGLESPSEGFESKFMMLLENETDHKTISRPLIPKSIWFFIGTLSVSLLGIGYYKGEEVSLFDSVFTKLKFSKYHFNISIPDFEISGIAFYSILFFVLMLLVQIALIKNRYDKTFSK